ncbi:MAG: hypothetical protein IPN65_04310 [Elusimicrobia bacterium]|nr:hypothetical protein [Elusimicrobiota bacterium]MBK7545557.1 hypothetical protein [Elusimicrobiota bacterium]MBK7575251.1 hypothetical protein [Elusimicrobiota bacterium]MBK7687892.1 hypothetical protein [Elusimicrobiota bacterium]MBK8125190.1 hypothetical protein [Elusimicrobiota bacterium]
MNTRTALVGVLGLLTVACASTKQYVAIPDQTTAVSPDKARIYVLRPVSLGGAVPMKVSDGSTTVGVTGPKGALCWDREPGPADIASHAENVHHLNINTEKGIVYYLLQRVKMGFMIARTKLEQLSKEEGEATLTKCKLPSAVSAAKDSKATSTAKPSGDY